MSSDLPQILLVGVIVVLTIVLVILGVQIFFILKESKETLNKVNKILDGATGIAGSANLFSNPLVKVVLGTAVAFFSGKNKIKKIREEKKTKPREKKPRRFFFKRS